MTNALNLQAPVDTWPWSSPASSTHRCRRCSARTPNRNWSSSGSGPHGLEMQIEEWDFKTHGGYRYVHSNEHGDFGFNGTFHTVRENEFIIQTFEFEGAPDMVNIEFMWFEDLGDGRSRLRGRSICPNTEARDALLSPAWRAA